jgi:hypothetical protein
VIIVGQYYLVVNIDKKEYLHPHKFKDGLKLLEFGSSGSGTMCGLAILLADGNGRGGGDLISEDPIIGSWAGDRIVIAGDYADEGKFLSPAPTYLDIPGNPATGDNDSKTLYSVAHETYTDISERVVRAMADDEYLRDDLKKAGVEI